LFIQGRVGAPPLTQASGADAPLARPQIFARRRLDAEGSFFSCFSWSSDEFSPVAFGGSCVIARLGNKVGNVYRPPGGDFSRRYRRCFVSLNLRRQGAEVTSKLMSA